jgi:SAM-dependent methyltransferase
MTETLTARQRRERELHDAWAAEIDPAGLVVEGSFTAPTALENQFILAYFGDVAGKSLLDLGAGAGEASLYFAARGARVTAVDVSDGQLDVLRRAATERGLSVEARACAAERLPFADGTFDFVYGNGVLHHVDIRAVIPEVLRVARTGARIAFVEPLTYNPVIWIYRRLAEGVRTPDERPLGRREIAWICDRLAGADHREFWIAALAVFLHMFLVERVSPSQDRYWKRVVREGGRYARRFAWLFALDRVLARVPGVRMLAWNTVIHGERPAGPVADGPG